MTHPLISISLITYNSAEFIKECLDSVLAQDYPNMEIVISDDASTDNTAEILKDYQQKNPHLIKLNLNSTNVGITKNFNITLALCTGKYVAFFAGDDVMLPGKISKQVAYMESHPECSISYHNVEVFFCGPLAEKKSFLHHHAVKPRQGGVRVSIKYGPFNAGCATMVRRDKIPAYGFDERLTIASDALFWVEVLESGGEIQYIDEVLARYRIHGCNVSRSKFPEMAFDFLIQHSKLLVKYPEYASDILYNYSNGLFLLAKSSPKSIDYLRASFRVKKRMKVLTLITLYYLSFGKLSFNSKSMRYLNELITGMRIHFNVFIQRYFPSH